MGLRGPRTPSGGGSWRTKLLGSRRLGRHNPLAGGARRRLVVVSDHAAVRAVSPPRCCGRCDLRGCWVRRRDWRHQRAHGVPENRNAMRAILAVSTTVPVLCLMSMRPGSRRQAISAADTKASLPPGRPGVRTCRTRRTGRASRLREQRPIRISAPPVRRRAPAGAERFPIASAGDRY
jgi:hypothetical protein